ncbi:helix-turn-helix family protein [Mycobacterium kansasii 732]|nr:helix-turn-helix family protein [Mycobacterium kansasii 732]
MTSPEHIRAQIASAVRAAREKRDLSASALADATDGAITRDTIANLESGRKRVIDVGEVIILAKALGVSPLSLIYPPSPSNAEAALAFSGYDNDDDVMKDLYHLHDAREWLTFDDTAPARQGYRTALRAAKRAGWVED